MVQTKTVITKEKEKEKGKKKNMIFLMDFLFFFSWLPEGWGRVVCCTKRLGRITYGFFPFSYFSGLPCCYVLLLIPMLSLGFCCVFRVRERGHEGKGGLSWMGNAIRSYIECSQASWLGAICAHVSKQPPPNHTCLACMPRQPGGTMSAVPFRCIRNSLFASD